jgi:hypothetical protein
MPLVPRILMAAYKTLVDPGNVEGIVPPAPTRWINMSPPNGHRPADGWITKAPQIGSVRERR